MCDRTGVYSFLKKHPTFSSPYELVNKIYDAISPLVYSGKTKLLFCYN